MDTAEDLRSDGPRPVVHKFDDFRHDAILSESRRQDKSKRGQQGKLSFRKERGCGEAQPQQMRFPRA